MHNFGEKRRCGILALATPPEEVRGGEKVMMRKPAVLVVMSSRERQTPLLSELRLMQAAVKVTESFREARMRLESDPKIDVVITDLTLADANWSDVLRFLVNRSLRASVVVSARGADEACWSEILWRGGYDLLVEPYEKSEVRRVVEGAARAARAAQLRTEQGAMSKAKSA